MATLKWEAPELLATALALAEIAIQAAKQGGKFVPQDLSNLLWAVATLKWGAPELLTTVLAPAARFKVAVADFNPQDVANTVWAIAALRKANPQLREPLSSPLIRSSAALTSFNGQDIAQTSWALAQCGLMDQTFMAAIASQVIAKIHTLHRSNLLLDLPPVLMACAKIGLHHDELMTAVASLYTAAVLRSISDWSVCAVALSYSRLDVRSEFRDFAELVSRELARSELSQEDVQSSLQGAQDWRRR